MAALYATVAAATLIGLAIVALTALKGWQDWLALKHRELDCHAPHMDHGGGRIELADLRERIRKLEAIAAGVEL